VSGSARVARHGGRRSARPPAVSQRVVRDTVVDLLQARRDIERVKTLLKADPRLLGARSMGTPPSSSP
jgi:hypothetical protein